MRATPGRHDCRAPSSATFRSRLTLRSSLPVVLLLVACSGSLDQPASGLPACTVFGPTFGVCVVNDMDVLGPESPLPFYGVTNTSGPATIEAVGSGAAPAQCQLARWFGLDRPSQWWLQARAADNRLWTIGVLGLGDSTPLIRAGDAVTLDFDWDGPGEAAGSRGPHAQLQLSDAAGAPLLWAGANAPASTWISFTAGEDVCAGSTACASGMATQRNVIATVNGSSMTLPPFGAASLGSYILQVTEFEPRCPGGDFEPNFQAAAARVLR